MPLPLLTSRPPSVLVLFAPVATMSTVLVSFTNFHSKCIADLLSQLSRRMTLLSSRRSSALTPRSPLPFPKRPPTSTTRLPRTVPRPRLSGRLFSSHIVRSTPRRLLSFNDELKAVFPTAGRRPSPPTPLLTLLSVPGSCRRLLLPSSLRYCPSWSVVLPI